MLAFKGFAKSGTCRLGHDDKEKGVQTGMEAAQTHGHIKVHIQTLCSICKQLHVMEEVQDSSRGETHEEDEGHQRAGLDVHRPVELGFVELPDNPDVAHNRYPQRHKEAEDGQEQVVVEQVFMGVFVQR